MLVKLITLLGYEEVLIVDERCTAEAMIDYVTKELETSTGPDMERLFMSKTPKNDLELRKGFMLKDYGIKDGSTIFVYVKLEDGKFRVTGVLMD